jgi:hypothetical protein
MHLLDYVSYMYWRQFEMLPIGLALKLGFHPLTEASFGQYFYYSTKTATSNLVAIDDSGNFQCPC